MQDYTGKRKCIRCHNWKYLHEFGKETRRWDGLNLYCKVCQNEQRMLSYERHRERINAKRRKKVATSRIGPKQREIIDVLQAGGEIHNSGGMWSVVLVKDRTRWSGRVSGASCLALYARGFIYHVRTDAGGYANGDRIVYGLTEKGKAV